MTKPLFRRRTSLANPWQFGLRAMLAMMASASVLLLVMGLVGLQWSLVLLWFLLLIAGHVVGNSWGSHQRQLQTPRPAVRTSVNDPPPLAADPLAVRLRHQAIFGRIDYLAIGAAALLGGGLGGAALWAAYWDRTGYSAIVVGSVSSAVIGGFLGFLCVTFTRVALQAVLDARHSARPDRYAPAEPSAVQQAAPLPAASSKSSDC